MRNYMRIITLVDKQDRPREIYKLEPFIKNFVHSIYQHGQCES